MTGRWFAADDDDDDEIDEAQQAVLDVLRARANSDSGRGLINGSVSTGELGPPDRRIHIRGDQP
jgi:hypothetical protein